MKPLQRLTALLLTAAMLLSLSCTAFAAETEPEVLSDESALTEPVEATEISEDTETFEEPVIEEEAPEMEETSIPEEPATQEPLPEEADNADTATTDAQPESLETASADSQTSLSYAQSNDLLVSDDYMITDDFGIEGEPEESWRFEDGQPITDGSEVIIFEGDEAPLNGASSYSTGIDVSKWQGTINWTKAAKKVSFAIIRCGYGTNKESNDDSMFLKNVQGCLDNGVPFGVYLYSYGESAKSEANHVLRTLEAASLSPKDVDFPIYLDMEDSSIITKSSDVYMTNSQKLTYVTTFCDAIEDAGYDAGVYANSYWWKTYLTSSKYDQWERWVACWGDMDYTGSYSMWQYSSTGSVSGISGDVDMDRWYGAIPSSDLTSTTPTLSSASYTGSAVQLKWSKVDGSKGYYVYRKEPGGSYSKIATVVGSTKLSYTDSTVKSGTSYIYCIKAYNSGSSSKASSSKTVITPPALKTALNTQEGIQVRWNAVTDAESYMVYRRTGSVDAERTCIATVEGSILSWLDTDVTAETTYYYDVQCVVGSVTSGYLKSPNAVVRMLAPATVNVAHSSSTSKNGLKVTWSQVTGATGYYIYRRTQDTESWTQIDKVTSGSTLSYVDSTPTDGGSYSYAVAAYCAGATGLQSDGTAPMLYQAAPTVKLSLKGTKATVTWTACAVTPDSYRVYRKISGGSWGTPIGEVSGDQTSFADPTALSKETNYVYTVRPVKDGVAGCYSASGAKIYILSTAPAAPTAANAANGVKLKWKKVTGATGYYVYMRTSSTASWKKIATIKSGSTVTYTYKSAPAGKIRQYAVQAYNAYSVSNRSAKTKKRYLKPPVVTLTNTTSTRIKLKWKKITGAKKYVIYRRIGTSGKWKKIKTTSSLSYIDKNLKKGTTYYYRVYARRGTNLSTYKTVKLKKK